MVLCGKGHNSEVKKDEFSLNNEEHLGQLAWQVLQQL
jgi:hypothetical protein